MSRSPKRALLGEITAQECEGVQGLVCESNPGSLGRLLSTAHAFQGLGV